MPKLTHWLVALVVSCLSIRGLEKTVGGHTACWCSYFPIPESKANMLDAIQTLSSMAFRRVDQIGSTRYLAFRVKVRTFSS